MYGTEILLIFLLILGLIKRLCCHREPSKARRGDPIVITILAIIAFAGLSIIWSVDKTFAAYSLLKLIEGVGLFWLVAYSVSSAALPTLKNWLIASGLVQGLFAIYQFFTQSTFAFKWLGLSFIEAQNPGASVVQFADERWLRAYGSLPHPNILGGFLVIILLLIVISLWQIRKRIIVEENFSRSLLYLNLFYWLSASVIFFALILTFSRGAWLGLAIGFIYLAVYAFVKKLKQEKIVCLKLAIVFTALWGVFLMAFPYQLLTTRLNTVERLEKYSITQRLSLLAQAKGIYKNHPVLGVGLGNYMKELQIIEPDKFGLFYEPVHSWYWLALTELGVLGFLLFAFLLINLWRKTDVISRALIISMGVMGLFDHYLWTLSFGLMLWWLVWGLAIKDGNNE